MDTAASADVVHCAPGARLELAGEALTVLVPCHNEAATVAELLTRVRRALPAAEIIVVDDGSTDGSAQAIAALRERLGLTIVSLPMRRGKGAAVREGLARAARSWIVIQDADLEYDPADLQRLAAEATAHPESAVYGSRYLQTGKAAGGSAINYLGVKVLSRFAGWLYGRRLSDPHTCYKMLPLSLVRELALDSDGFELCAEITGKLLERGTPIIEVPISYRPRTAAAGKKIGIGDFFQAIRTYWRCRFQAGAALTSTLHAANDTANDSALEAAMPTRAATLGYVVSRFVLGALLIVAGGIKLAPWRSLALFHWLVLPAPAVLLVGAAELALGCLAVSFLPWRAIHRMAVAALVLYIGVLALQFAAGESTCNCLGASSLPVVGMLALDATLLAAVWIFRRQWRQPLTALSGSVVGELFSAMRFALPALVLGGLLAFGSLDAAISYATGARLVAISPTRHAGDVIDGETVAVTFELTNYDSRPVRIAGAKATCKCLAWDDLPMTIAPGASRQITIRLRGGGPAPRVQRESAYLVFDNLSTLVALTATARVTPAP